MYSRLFNSAAPLAVHAAVAVAASVMLVSTAHAQEARRAFDIKEQPLGAAIIEFSRQSGAVITTPAELTQNRRSSALRGSMTTEAALEQLLRGTGLVARSTGGATYTLTPLAGARASAPFPVPEADVSEVVVTGSRIARPELESAMPVSVTKVDEALRFGRVTAYDLLQLDPAIGAGLNGLGGCSECQTPNDSGVSALNLRNLGTNRSLTLIDGRRRVSSSARASAVDIGAIPVGMIDRIEVVTGGAAAVYGADAMTGAVNVITKKHVEGFNATAHTGVSERGDSSQSMISASTGGAFAGDRGSFAIGGTYTHSSPLAYGDRYDPNYRLNYFANPKNTGPADGVPDRLLGDGFGGIFQSFKPNYYLKGKEYILDNGAVREAHYADFDIPGELSNGSGGDARRMLDVEQLFAKVDSASLMGRAAYRISDNIDYEAHFEYARSYYDDLHSYPRFDMRNGADSPIARLDNPYLPASLRQVMVDNGLTELRLRRSINNVRRPEINRRNENFTVEQSLSGDLSGGLKWEAFYQYGHAQIDSLSKNVLRLSHWRNAKDVIADPTTGQPVCRSAAARAEGCLPFNIFSTEMPSEGVLDYLAVDRHAPRSNEQQIFGADINGRIFTLPAGDVSGAFGLERRVDKLKTKEDPLQTDMYGQYVPIADLDVSKDVNEAYGEILIPILRDLPFARRLEVEGAYRYSDDSTFGGIGTWKVGGSWAPVHGLTLRGVRSRSTRAPNFGELYEPQHQLVAGLLEDPCGKSGYNRTPVRAANCLALGITTPFQQGVAVGVLSGGNPELQPEVSDAYTLGLVAQPTFLHGFDLTLDYWNIGISNVITAFSQAQILNLCVDLPTIENRFCDLVTRDPDTHAPVNVNSISVNASKLYARGVDLGANYRRSVGEGRFSASLKATYLLDQMSETTPGIAAGNIRSDGSWSNPKIRGSVILNYDMGTLGVGMTMRYIGAGKIDVNAPDHSEAYPDNTVSATVYTDLSANYKLNDKYNIGVGVRNAFDVQPPNFPPTYFNTSVYDQIGRYFFVSANLSL